MPNTRRRRHGIAEDHDRRDQDRPMGMALTWEQAAALHDIGRALGGPELHPAMVRACDAIEARMAAGMPSADVLRILTRSGVTAAVSAVEDGEELLAAVSAAFGKGGNLNG